MRKLVGLGLLAGAGALLWKFGLTDEAKNGLTNAANTVRDAYGKVTETINAAYGQVMPDDNPLPNQQATRQDWENLGF